MIVEPEFPERLARGSIYGVQRRARVAEIGRETAACDWADHHTAADANARVVGPIRTSGGGIERINLAAAATHEHTPTNNGRLGEGYRCVGKPECPLQLQFRHIGSRETRFLLIPRIRSIGAPAIPTLAAHAECLRTRRARSGCRLSAGCPDLFACQVTGDGAGVFIVQ